MVMREDNNIAQEIKEIIHNTERTKKQKGKKKKNTARSVSVRRHIHIYGSIHVTVW